MTPLPESYIPVHTKPNSKGDRTDQDLDANPLMNHADRWPRKARHLVDAIAAALKLYFLVSSQRSHNSPSTAERAFAGFSQANETIREMRRVA